MGNKEKHRREHHKHAEKIRLNERPMNEAEEKGMGLTFWLSSYSRGGKREFELPNETQDDKSSVTITRTTHLQPTSNGNRMILRDPPATISMEGLQQIDSYLEYATSDVDNLDTNPEISKTINGALAQIFRVRRLLS